MAAEGWLQVMSTSALGVAGNYYTLLDVSEAGYESGFAMTGATGGRPQSQALTNPSTNKAQAWMIAAHDAGKYVLQCAQDNKYFRCDGAGWNTGFTDDINADGTDFTFTLNSGKWTLSNEKDAGNFVGRWGNSVFHPFQGENIAANKSANAGKKQYLIYAIPSAVGTATELPNTGEMAADTWYYFDNDVAGEYNVVATALGDISYYTSVDPTTSSSFDVISNMVQARYYVKSTSDNNLKVSPHSYTYTVGEATPSIPDGSYTQTQSLTTISFDIDASSNDPDATFAILNNTATAALSAGGSPVANGTLSLSGTTLTATFSEVSLDLNTTYTIEIAADVVGYAGHATNAAISTSFKTGVIANGEYYFQKKNTQTYIGRGGDWGTRAVVTELGISLDVSMLPNGKYYLKNHDWSLAANTDKYIGFSTDANDFFVDRSADTYTINAVEGGYILKTSNDRYVKTSTNSSNDVPYEYLDPTDTEAEAIVWVPISKETYLANLAALRNAEASAIATSAGKSASTVAELASLLASDFGATDVTSSIRNSDCKANLDNWTQVNYAVGNKNFDANGTCGEVWDGFGGIKQEISDLPKGIYKVSIHATWRPGDSGSGNRAGDDINTNAWVYANTATSSNLTQLKSWYAGGATINSRADMVASGDTYLNDVYVYVSEGETLTIGLASPSRCNGAWLPFFGWSLTRYEAKATPAEKQALAEAIEAADAKTLGFENGEYAPYNNVDAVTALAAAKAINPETASGEAVVAATEALNDAVWTANTEEVNAIYAGDFDTYYTVNGQDFPYGWNLYNGNDNKSRIMGGHEGTTNVGLEATSKGKALLMKYNATYGEEDEYCMPLKANTVYKITFLYGGWNDQPNTIVSLTDPNDEAITLSPNFRPETKDAYSNAEDWYTYTGYFVTTTAGQYKIHFNKVESGQQQIVISDIELKSANTLLIEEDDNLPAYAPGTYPNVTLGRIIKEGINTVVLPFSMTQEDVENYFGAGSKVYIVDTYNQSKENITFATQDGIIANRPCLLKATEQGISYEIANCTVDAASAAPEYVGTHVSMIGNYAPTFVVPEDANNYVISGGKFIFVDTDDVTMRGTRAYIKLADGNNARELIMILDDDPTAINSIEASEEAGALKDGKYFINGRFVIVNNGLVFGANG
ncbi:MAG: hypothetical protein J6035_07090, partial [Bacteroidaceae bacterium]|nr:hypothetical protein [Bacteroidaceae bacterium]